MVVQAFIRRSNRVHAQLSVGLLPASADEEEQRRIVRGMAAALVHAHGKLQQITKAEAAYSLNFRSVLRVSNDTGKLNLKAFLWDTDQMKQQRRQAASARAAGAAGAAEAAVGDSGVEVDNEDG